RPWRANVRLLCYRSLRGPPRTGSCRRDAGGAGGGRMSETPLLKVKGVSKFYGQRIGCADVCFDLWPCEVLATVVESGSGKTTLLNCISTRLMPTAGRARKRVVSGTTGGAG